MSAENAASDEWPESVFPAEEGAANVALDDVGSAAPAYLRADEVALAYSITVAEVYRLANEHGWRRFRWRRRVHYCYADIRDTMVARRVA